MPDDIPFDPSGLFPGRATAQNTNTNIAVSGFNDALKAIFAGLGPLLAAPRTVLHDFTPSAKEFLVGLINDYHINLENLAATIAAERKQVGDAVDSLKGIAANLQAQVDALNGKLANSESLTPEDVQKLADLIPQVQDIFTPEPAPEPTPAPTPEAPVF